MQTPGKSKTQLIGRPNKFDVFSAIEEKDRSKISTLVMREDVSLGMVSSENGRSLLYCLMEKVCNGDKIILRKLDSCLVTSNQDPDSDDFYIQVDLTKLVGEEERRDPVLIRDILKLPRRVSRRILNHPVIVTYIQQRWDRTRWSFLVSFLIYTSFVLFFSFFLGMMYWRYDHNQTRVEVKLSTDCQFSPVVFEDQNNGGKNGIQTRFDSTAITFSEDDQNFDVKVEIVKQPKNRSETRALKKLGLFSGCSQRRFYRDVSMCTVEILLVFTIFLLVIQELWQIVAQRREYFKELENWFELVIIIFAISTICLKQDLDTLKIISAVGICLAWLQLIFLFGRYPFLGGKFSIMYYTVTKRISKTALGFFVMLFGFSFAFFIMNSGIETESFGNIFQTFLKILVMLLGEFEFNDLYANSSKSGNLALTFTMFLLLGLIVFGTIIMLNLIVAIIITDIDWLHQMSQEQGLRNQALHVLQIHSLLSISDCLKNKISRQTSRSSLLPEFCSHNVCSCSKSIV
ncbi:transient receptor potential channel pyrexia isoform X3 [Eurytemora carolleeae]|uniref:transient receptor potential channel pyrexia isoform X3 n=1 Tax=Eurytemora carolleeae TaxID=1294199 RepID=UPI000C78E1BE|nr:transient receptor potential channel pyrexia isoform X3 [Eurytemora carolleeae]|eukprot:XP_023324793.1 transient receptor potential channel pyrexia-like isoform X3 [Eurytemora affinis]